MEIEFSEKQQQTYRHGRLVDIHRAADSPVVSSDSTDHDSSGYRQGMRMSMTDSFSAFQSPEEYTFSLENSAKDSLLVIQVVPKNWTQQTYKGMFTLRKSEQSLLRAQLTPGVEIPHVKSMETSVISTTFEGFPVSRSINSRFQGGYLLVFTFNMGFHIEMEYAELEGRSKFTASSSVKSA